MKTLRITLLAAAALAAGTGATLAAPAHHHHRHAAPMHQAPQTVPPKLADRGYMSRMPDHPTIYQSMAGSDAALYAPRGTPDPRVHALPPGF